tara:strand:- start:2239 stop:2775 length:537 start_codon:yes stop_codon:yes gene_type:complete
MLGLGNTVITSPAISGLTVGQVGNAYLTVNETSDEDVYVAFTIDVTSTNIDNVLTPDTASVGARITGVSFTLKVERYNDTIANGGTVQAQATDDVFLYFNAALASFRAYYTSHVEDTSLTQESFGEQGSSRYDLSSFGDSSTDLTASGTNHYVFTLTGQANGYTDWVVATSEISITAP